MMDAKKLMSTILASAIIGSSVHTVSYGEFLDMPSNWAKPGIENAIKNGLLKGMDGKLNPNGVLTRAQMATVVNRMLGLKEDADLSNYEDMDSSNWHYSEISKSVSAGIFQGSNNEMNSDKAITREEAFLVIARVMDLSKGEKPKKNISDYDEISTWSRNAINSLVDLGYIKGNEKDEIKPKANITRAEFATVLKSIADEYVQNPGLVKGKTINGNLFINSKYVNLENLKIKGDLILAEGVSLAETNLSSVEVEGRILVRAGKKLNLKASSADSIRVLEDIDGLTVDIDKNSVVNTLVTDSKLKLIGKGKLNKAVFNKGSKKSTVELTGVKLELGEDVTIIDDKGKEIDIDCIVNKKETGEKSTDKEVSGREKGPSYSGSLLARPDRPEGTDNTDKPITPGVADEDKENLGETEKPGEAEKPGEKPGEVEKPGEKPGETEKLEIAGKEALREEILELFQKVKEDEKKYTEESFAYFDGVRGEAEGLLEKIETDDELDYSNISSVTKDELQKMKDRLEAAIDVLEFKSELGGIEINPGEDDKEDEREIEKLEIAGKEALREEILELFQKVKEEDEKKYTEESFAYFDGVRGEAEGLLEKVETDDELDYSKVNNVTKDELQEMKDRLEAAIDILEFKSELGGIEINPGGDEEEDREVEKLEIAGKEALREEILELFQKVKEEDKDKYTEESFAYFDGVRGDAEGLLEEIETDDELDYSKINNVTVEELQEMKDKLEAAIDVLEFKSELGGIEINPGEDDKEDEREVEKLEIADKEINTLLEKYEEEIREQIDLVPLREIENRFHSEAKFGEEHVEYLETVVDQVLGEIYFRDGNSFNGLLGQVNLDNMNIKYVNELIKYYNDDMLKGAKKFVDVELLEKVEDRLLEEVAVLEEANKFEIDVIEALMDPYAELETIKNILETYENMDLEVKAKIREQENIARLEEKLELLKASFKIGALEEEDYTEASFEKVLEAHDNAETILENTQDNEVPEIREAIEKIEKAISELVTKEENEELEELKEELQGLVEELMADPVTASDQKVIKVVDEALNVKNNEKASKEELEKAISELEKIKDLMDLHNRIFAVKEDGNYLLENPNILGGLNKEFNELGREDALILIDAHKRLAHLNELYQKAYNDKLEMELNKVKEEAKEDLSSYVDKTYPKYKDIINEDSHVKSHVETGIYGIDIAKTSKEIESIVSDKKKLIDLRAKEITEDVKAYLK